jgi:hypothetical protein
MFETIKHETKETVIESTIEISSEIIFEVFGSILSHISDGI